MVNEIDRKLNVYFVNNKTDEIFWHNIMWGGGNYYHPATIRALPLCENPGNYPAVYEGYIYLEPNDYRVVLGAVIEIIGIIEARAEQLELAIDAAAIRDDILLSFTNKLTRLQCRAIREHYIGMGDIE